MLNRGSRLGMILWLHLSLLLKQRQLVLNQLNRCKQRYVLVATHHTPRLCAIVTSSHLNHSPISSLLMMSICLTLAGGTVILHCSWPPGFNPWSRSNGCSCMVPCGGLCGQEQAARFSELAQMPSTIHKPKVLYWQENRWGIFSPPYPRSGFRLCFALAEMSSCIFCCILKNWKSLQTRQDGRTFAFCLVDIFVCCQCWESFVVLCCDGFLLKVRQEQRPCAPVAAVHVLQDVRAFLANHSKWLWLSGMNGTHESSVGLVSKTCVSAPLDSIEKYDNPWIKCGAARSIEAKRGIRQHRVGVVIRVATEPRKDQNPSALSPVRSQQKNICRL
jgi:hypothetical protein